MHDSIDCLYKWGGKDNDIDEYDWHYLSSKYHQKHTVFNNEG